MTDDLWNDVDAYVTDAVVRPDPRIEAAIPASSEAGLPEIAVTAAQGKLLALLAAVRGARRILEVGTLGGYSTSWLAGALPADGLLVSLEIDPHHAEVAHANLVHAGVADRVDVIVGPALDSLRDLAGEGSGAFDFVFIDADKANNAAYFDYAVRLGRPGTVIVVDNVVRDGGVIDHESMDPAIIGTRRLHVAVGEDSRVDATVIQTVGSKGYDGFLLAVVK